MNNNQTPQGGQIPQEPQQQPSQQPQEGQIPQQQQQQPSQQGQIPQQTQNPPQERQNPNNQQEQVTQQPQNPQQQTQSQPPAQPPQAKTNTGNKKKIILWILIILILLGGIIFAAIYFLQDTEEEELQGDFQGKFEYEEYEDGIAITGFELSENVEEEDLEQDEVRFFPSEIDEQPVRKIRSVDIPYHRIGIPKSVNVIGGPASFELDGTFQNQDLKEVVIEEGVEIIKDQAFLDNKISELNIPESLEEIGGEAFAENEIDDITIPKNLEIIEYESFRDNNIENITLHDDIKEINREAFMDNNLTNIEIPSNTYVGDYAFKNNNLTEVTVGDNVEFGDNVFENNEGLDEDKIKELKGDVKEEDDDITLEDFDDKKISCPDFEDLDDMRRYLEESFEKYNLDEYEVEVEEVVEDDKYSGMRWETDDGEIGLIKKYSLVSLDIDSQSLIDDKINDEIDTSTEEYREKRSKKADDLNKRRSLIFEDIEQCFLNEEFVEGKDNQQPDTGILTYQKEDWKCSADSYPRIRLKCGDIEDIEFPEVYSEIVQPYERNVSVYIFNVVDNFALVGKGPRVGLGGSRVTMQRDSDGNWSDIMASQDYWYCDKLFNADVPPELFDIDAECGECLDRDAEDHKIYEYDEYYEENK